MREFEVSIVTPSGKVESGQYDLLIAKADQGEIGIMAGHIPLVTPIKIGAVRLNKGKQTEWLAVSEGFLEVRPDHVTILAQSAEKAATIDLARAQAAKKRAEEKLANKTENFDLNRADFALKRAINRIEISGQR